MSFFQAIQFQYKADDDVRSFLRGFSEVAAFEESSDFYYYSQLAGQPAFKFDCEFVNGGLFTTREGEYFMFLGYFLEALTKCFGAIEIGPEGACF